MLPERNALLSCQWLLWWLFKVESNFRARVRKTDALQKKKKLNLNYLWW